MSKLLNIFQTCNCPICHQKLRLIHLEQHIRTSHPGKKIDISKCFSTKGKDTEEHETKNDGSQSSRRKPASKKKAARRSKVNSASGNIQIPFKPITVKADAISDETGRLIDYQFWIDNQRLGDSTPRPAQSATIEPAIPAFERIQEVQDTYSPVKIRRCPICGNKTSNMKEYLRRWHPKLYQPVEGEILPVLAYRAAKIRWSPDGIKKHNSELKAPCLLCGKPVTANQWSKHMDTVHNGYKPAGVRKAFLTQKIRCGMCGYVVSFSKCEEHFDRTHPKWRIVKICILPPEPK